MVVARGQREFRAVRGKMSQEQEWGLGGDTLASLARLKTRVSAYYPPPADATPGPGMWKVLSLFHGRQQQLE